MNESFKDGFEKIAYDYKHEVNEKEHYAKSRENDEPVGWKKSVGIGAGLGVGLGALIGSLVPSKASFVKKVLGSSAAGVLGGAAIGALYKIFDESDIDEQKRIMAMPKEERAAYLASRAREEFHRRTTHYAVGGYPML